MSYDVVNPTYYQTFQPGTPFHPGAPGWTQAPFPTWGENPNLAGRRRLATDGLGNVVAISGLGSIIKSSDPKFVCPADAPHREIDSRSGVTCYGDAEWAALQRQQANVPPPVTRTIEIPPVSRMPPWLRAVSTLSAAACAYHGYKRNESVGWAFGWAFFGSVAPFFALPVALAQGFGKPKKMQSNRRRRKHRKNASKSVEEALRHPWNEEIFLVQGRYGNQWTTDRIFTSEKAAGRHARGYKKHGIKTRVIRDWRPAQGG